MLKTTVPRTAREYLQRILADAGQERARYGEVYLLPFQIESLKLENVGLFEEFEVKFRRNAINVICGSGGSGKSTIVRAILLAFGRRHKYFKGLENGRIALELFQDQRLVSIATNDDNSPDVMRGYRCLVADEVFERAREPSMIPVLSTKMKNFRTQIIITASKAVNPYKFIEEANIISLKNPMEQVAKTERKG